MKSRCIKKIFMVSILLLIAIGVSLFANYRYEGAFARVNRKLPIYCVDTKDKKVAITFDVSLGDEYIDKILNVLDKTNIKTPFFLVGNLVAKNPKKLKGLYIKEQKKEKH
ncbi:polysaccharide deacetylase family protein [Clostridium autoethanogenum]|uniref:polysaccharide deacetylase family protein n=1 Tax=Clostridium autoethanogenum TaxID=84023 RepID=UPI001FA9DB37|nr:polysaccharide deacetylase family protein [Clostridium autoethanogenum]